MLVVESKTQGNHCAELPHFCNNFNKSENLSSYSFHRFPSSKFPVLAFQGAPGNFPSLREHQFLQKYVEFSERLSKQADDYIKNELKGDQYIGIHLRNGQDMVSFFMKIII